MSLPRRWLGHESIETYKQLDADTRRRFTSTMDQVCANPGYGKPLNRPLTDCDTAYVVDVATDTRGGQPDFRVVYRFCSSRMVPEYVQIICIGPRIGLTVYKLAEALLGRG